MKIYKTKSLVRPNKYNFSVNAIEKSHFWHSGVISEEKANEDLDTNSQVKCQESGSKVFSMRLESDINQEFLEDAKFGSKHEKGNQASFRGDALTVEEELIPDYEIPVSANKLKDRAKKKSNTDSSETEKSYESQSSVNRENDDSRIEERFQLKNMAELM
ncbi:hypothetical protein AVEN_149866-1 [Araneus ventricosus]|uniref:Uncharacterized protein n=1 Tax=Araneus ventricosus TaxID=182803 RepID=A0A4Y2DWP7_ARAVE|nr:hypothetical protein AVEN_149866-1 [Araneus ventricosus]